MAQRSPNKANVGEERRADAIGAHHVYLLHPTEHTEPLVKDAETAGYRVVPPPAPETTQDLFSPASGHARHFFVAAAGDDCLSSNARLSRVLMVIAALVNCVTPPYLPGVPPPLEEDDDEIEQVRLSCET